MAGDPHEPQRRSRTYIVGLLLPIVKSFFSFIDSFIISYRDGRISEVAEWYSIGRAATLR